jgi:hypothetical protein
MAATGLTLTRWGGMGIFRGALKSSCLAGRFLEESLLHQGLTYLVVN